MNNREQELLKREQEKQERIKREKFQGALNMPSLTRDAIDPYADDNITQHYNEDNRMPALSNTAKDPYATHNYVDDWEQEVREGGVQENFLPSIGTTNNRRLS